MIYKLKPLFLLTIKGLAVSVLALIFLWVVLFTRKAILYYDTSVTLPNGMILKREFDLSKYRRDDLFAAGGRRLLARDVESVCFNDRYVQADGGLFDGQTNELISREDWDTYIKVYRSSGLQNRWGGCGGYYTGMVGPGLLYPGNSAPFLPSCEWRNLENTALADWSWFDRPCVDRFWPRRPGG